MITIRNGKVFQIKNEELKKEEKIISSEDKKTEEKKEPLKQKISYFNCWVCHKRLEEWKEDNPFHCDENCLKKCQWLNPPKKEEQEED